MKRPLGWILSLGVLALPAFAGSQKVSKSEFGDSWPLTVDEGVLTCEGAGAVTFTANGVTYAVNGLATSTKKHANIDPIWMPGSVGPKKSIGTLIDRGLKLCN